MSVQTYKELKTHIGHKITCVAYGSAKDPENVAIECVTCSEVILDRDKWSCPECGSEMCGDGENHLVCDECDYSVNEADLTN